MGSQPIRIQLGKILWENLAGNCCRKILWEMLWENLVGRFCWKIWHENLVGKSCRKILQEILVGKSCRKFFREVLAGKSCGTRRRGKSQFKKGSDWWKFSIWNRVMGSQPIRIQLGKILWENLVGKSCGKLLQENLVGNCYGKILWENLVGKSCGKYCGKFPIPNSHTFKLGREPPTQKPSITLFNHIHSHLQCGTSKH